MFAAGESNGKMFWNSNFESISSPGLVIGYYTQAASRTCPNSPKMIWLKSLSVVRCLYFQWLMKLIWTEQPSYLIRTPGSATAILSGCHWFLKNGKFIQVFAWIFRTVSTSYRPSTAAWHFRKLRQSKWPVQGAQEGSVRSWIFFRQASKPHWQDQHKVDSHFNR